MKPTIVSTWRGSAPKFTGKEMFEWGWQPTPVEVKEEIRKRIDFAASWLSLQGVDSVSAFRFLTYLIPSSPVTHIVGSWFLII